MNQREQQEKNDTENADAADFLQSKRLGKRLQARPKPDRTEARKAVQAASGVARAILAGEAPPEVFKPDLVAATAPSSSEVRCGCGQELGGQTRGVNHGGSWHCPKCFMGVRDMNGHAVARPVNCPTCGATTVDFTGRNVCSVCHARGARPQ